MRRNLDPDARVEDHVCNMIGAAMSDNDNEASNAFQKLRLTIRKHDVSGGTLKEKLRSMLAAGQDTSARESELSGSRERIRDLEAQVAQLQRRTSSRENDKEWDHHFRERSERCEMQAKQDKSDLLKRSRKLEDVTGVITAKQGEIDRLRVNLHAVRGELIDSRSNLENQASRSRIGVVLGFVIGGTLSAVLTFMLSGRSSSLKAPTPLTASLTSPLALQPHQAIQQQTVSGDREGNMGQISTLQQAVSELTAAPNPDLEIGAGKPSGSNWSHWTPAGTGWKIQRSVQYAGQYDLIVKLDERNSVFFVTDPNFLKLSASEMSVRVDWLKSQMANPGSWGRTYEYTREGVIRPMLQ